jgi:hypothetical protein
MKRAGGSVFGTFAVLGLVALTASSAQAHGSRCSKGEIDAAGLKADKLASCVRKAVATNAPVSAECVMKAEAMFSTGFMMAAGFGGCLSSTAAGVIEAKVDNFIDTIHNDVDGGASGPSTCDAKKIFVSGKKAVAEAHCYALAVRQGIPFTRESVQRCVMRATKHFDKHIATVEGLGSDCTHTGQTAVLDGDVDAFVNDLTNELAPPPTTTTTTTTTSTT